MPDTPAAKDPPRPPHHKSRLNRMYRTRSNTEDQLGVEQDSSVDFPWRPRLYELFGAIEREFEALYAENQLLLGKVEVLSERLGEGGAGSSAGGDWKEALLAQEAKAASKARGSQVGQKLKTALRVPPGRLVSSFKAGVGAVGGGGDAARVRFLRSFRGHRDGIWGVATNAGPPCLASASADQTARLWNPDTGQCLTLYNGHKGSVNSVAFSPTQCSAESLTLLTGSGDQSAHIWRAPLTGGAGSGSGKAAPTASSEEEVEAGSGDEEAEDALVVRAPALELTGHTGVVICADWVAGGDKALTGSWDRTAHVYDAERGEVLNILSGHDLELTAVAGAAGSALLATASRDTTFRLWDFREAIGSVAVFQGHSDTVNAVAFAPDDHRLVSGSDDRCVKVWDLRNMRAPEASVRLDSPVNRLAVSHKGVVAIPQDNRHVRLFSLSGQRLGRLPRAGRPDLPSHRRMVCATAWLGPNLFSAGFDKQLLAWSFAPAKE